MKREPFVHTFELLLSDFRISPSCVQVVSYGGGSTDTEIEGKSRSWLSHCSGWGGVSGVSGMELWIEDFDLEILLIM